MAEWIAEYRYKRLDEIHNVINDVYKFKCSSCGWSTGQQGIAFQFCPYCGERMGNANNPRVVPVSVLEDIKAELWMEGMNMVGEYQGVWVRFKDIEKAIDKHINGANTNV